MIIYLLNLHSSLVISEEIRLKPLKKKTPRSSVVRALGCRCEAFQNLKKAI